MPKQPKITPEATPEMLEGLRYMVESAEQSGVQTAFKAATLKISGPINYKTEIMGFCCRRMRSAISKAEYIYNGKRVKLWGSPICINKCPFCGEVYNG